MTDHIFRNFVRAFTVVFSLIGSSRQLPATVSKSKLVKLNTQVILKIHDGFAFSRIFVFT